MSISFSGLASGLDTSSWIESLVALKQAKVTTLKEERENVVLSKDTLNSIKSFFSSFRSTIEKITDSKFHIASMDLFAQNIATSANLEVLTATATTDADEGVYNVRVDKLATNTNAISDYRYLTTIVETTTATLDSKLKDIGVKAGNIGVTNNGVTYSVNITDKDTIGSFIEKLKDIGVEASFNNATGIFSVNLSKNAITDTDNTGIVDALHIEGVNEGYTSNKLQIEKVETVYSVANENSFLNELSSGVKITGTKNVTVQNTSGDNYTIEVDAFTTLGEFLQGLRDAGLNAEVKNGVVEISGGKITGGTYDAIKALGLVDDPYTSQVKGNALTETIVEYEIVTYDTRLVDDLGVSEGYLEVIDSEGDAQYLKIYSGQTIGDLMSDLANMGIYSTLDEDNGILSITGGDFNTLTDADVNALIANGTIRETNDRYKHGTDLLTALYGAPAISAHQTAVSQTYATSQALNKSVTKTISATEATRLDELGITTNETITLHKEDGSTVSFDVTGSTTLGDLLTSIKNNGVTAKLEDGVIYLEGGWMENSTVEDALGLEHSTSSSYVLGCERTVTKTYDADSDTKLSEMGLGDSVITVKGQDDVVLGTVTTNADMTIGEILTALAGYGISGTIKNGVISLDSQVGAYAEGGVLDDFGVGTQTTTFTTSIGVVNTSSSVVAATYAITADSSTTLGDLGLGDSTVSIKTTDGTTVGTVTTFAEMTIGDLLTAFAGYEISGIIKDGVISLKSDDGKYIEGGIATSLGISTTNSTYTTTTGTSNTSSSVISLTTSVKADSSTKLSDIGLGLSTVTIKGTDGTTVGTVTTFAEMTIGDLLTAFAGYEISGTIKDGVISLKSDDGKYIEGGITTSLGISTTNSTYTTTTGTSNTSSSVISLTTSVKADSSTKLSDIGLGLSTVTIKGTDGSTVGTITTQADMTIGEFLTALSGYGISGTIKDGVISLKSDDGKYIEGGIATSLGISTTDSTFTTTAGVDNTSTVAVSVTISKTADSSTTLGELGLGVSTVNVCSTDGNVVGTITTNADMTIGDLLTAFAGYEISGTIKDGVISLKSDANKYVTGGVVTSMGIGTTDTTVTVREGIGTTSSAALTYNTTTYTTTYPTLTRTLITTSTIVTTDPVIGTQTITVSDTITVTEPVIGTKTVTVNHTHTETVAEIGSKTVTVTDTVTVPVASIGSQTITVTHSHTCTEAQVGYETIRITATVISTETDTQLTTISQSFTTNVVSNFTQTVTVSTSSTITISTSSATTVGLAWTSSEPITVLKTTTQTIRITTTVAGTGTSGPVPSNTTIYTAFGTDATCYLTLSIMGTGGVIVTCTASDTIGRLVDKLNEAVTSVAGYNVIAAWTYDTTKGIYWADSYTEGQVFIQPFNCYTTQTTMPGWGNVKFVWDSGVNYIEALQFELDDSSSGGSSTSGTSYLSTGQATWSCNGAYGTVTSSTTVNQLVDSSYSSTYQYSVFTFSSSTTNKYITITYGDTIATINSKLQSAGVGELVVSDGFGRLTLYDNYTDTDDDFVNDMIFTAFAFNPISGTDGVASLSSTPLSELVGWADNPDLELVVGDTTFNISGTYDLATISSVQTLVNIIQNDINGVAGNGYWTVTYDSTLGAMFIKPTTSSPRVSVEIDSHELYYGLHYTSSSGSVLWFLKEAEESSGGGSVTVTTITTTVTTKTLLTSSDMIGEILATTYGVDAQFGALYNQSYFELNIYSTDDPDTILETITLYPNATIDSINGKLSSKGYGTASVTDGVATISPASGYYFDWVPHVIATTGGTVGSDPLKLQSNGYTVNESSTETVQTIVSAGTQTITGSVTTPVSWSFSTVVEEVTGTRSVTNLVVSTITVENTTTKTVTHLSTTTHVVEKTSTAPQTYTISDTFVVDTVKYKTVTHTTSSTHTVENTTTKTSTYTVSQTFTVENTTTKPVTITVYGTAVYSTTTVSVASTTTSYTADESSKFSQLGMTSDGTITVRTKNSEGGENSYVVTVNSSDTVGDMIASLAGLGIFGSMQGGRVTLRGDEDAYIFGISSNLETALKVQGGLNKTYADLTYTNSTNTNSSVQSYNTTNTMTTDDTFASLGLTADGSIILNSDGVLYTVTVRTTDTVDDMLTKLAGYGIAGSVDDGKLTLKGDKEAYITSVSSGLKTFLKLGDTNYTTTTHTTKANTSSSAQGYNTTNTMTTDDTFASLGLTSDGSIILNSDGVLYTVTVRTTDTVDDMLTKLAGYGIAGSVDDGKLTLKGDKEAYITSVSSGLKTFLKLGDTNYTTTTHTTKANTSSSAQGYNTTNTMTTDDTFASLGLTSDGSIILNSDGVLYTVTVRTTDTVDDMLTKLAGYGIAGSVDGGKLTLKGDKEAFITSISSGLKTFLKLGDTNYTTATHTNKANTTSSEQKYNTTNTLSTDDTLGLHGLTADGTITVVSDGTQHVVTVHAGDTIDDMLTSLAGLGIYGYVNGGKLSLQGDDEAFIKGISANLKTALKLGETNFVTEDHTVTKNTNSNHLTHNVTTLMSDSTLLTDLGITNGNFKITEKGVDYTYNLDTSTIKTIGDFRNLLSNYGFTSYVDEQGRLVIKGDGDSYLTSVTGGSNILTQLDIDDWTFGKMTQQSSWLTDTTIVDDGRVNGDTLMTELRDKYGNLLGITTGEFVVVSNGVRTVETINADTTVDDFKSILASYGMVMNLATDGSITVGAQHNSYLATSASAGVNTNAIDVLFAEWNFVNVYTSNNIEIPEDVVVAMTRDTKLADINEGTYVDGCITVVHDGIQTNLSLTADDTVGTLMDELALYGFESVINNSGQLIIKSDGKATLQAYTGADKASNLLTLLGINSANWIQTNSYKNEEIQTSEVVTSHLDATYDTKLSDLDLTWDNNALKAGGVIGLTVDGMSYKINIDADETFGSLKDKFAALGLEATISDGVLMIQSGYKDMVIDTANTTSNIVGDFGLTFHNDLGGYSASNDEVEQTISWTEDVVLSVSNYADYDTKMSLLNISSGTLSVFRDGQRATVNVNSDETFGQLRSRIATAFADVDIKFENGYLKFYSKTGASVEVGSTTDTSNISAICGFVNDKTGTVKSARELYRVNGDSKITTAGLFRRGNVTQGTFTVGDAVFTIDGNTTLQNIISQINASESANATASWDSVDGKLVIKSRTTGSSFINIEAGTSNFTDIMGYTKTEVDATNGAVVAKRLDVSTQDVGNNAVFTINGTTYTSTSNTIASDVSRITGVTINLKGVSEGEEVKLTVERDKETVANAVSDIVDAYNELIENVDKEVAKGATLADQSTLKFIRNQIRSLMTSSISGTGVFRNLDAIGISLDSAKAGDISTSNINVLGFDKDKFLKAFDADRDALKDLLVGTDTTKGVFQQVETVLETALTSNYGYFASADKSYSNQISKLDDKITKAQKSVERYRERLEAKFASMDLLIANIQNQYSSFLS